MNRILKYQLETVSSSGGTARETFEVTGRAVSRKTLRERVMLRFGVMALLVGSCCLLPQSASAITPGDADTAINSFNAAFLVNSGGQTYYKRALNDNASDGTWTLALDIMGMQDAYERTGLPAHRTLVNNLCTSFLQINPPPWSWDGWNDDIAWFCIALARGYQMTGTTNFLTQAEYGFNYVFNRGWDTQYNGGGIWEHQPNYPGTEPHRKEALSNNTMGKLACMLYQSTGNLYYRDKAIQIYNWSRSHIYNPNNGQVYTGVFPDGSINQGTAVYNQGTFIDFANLMHKVTGQVSYYNDAIKAVDFTRTNLTTNGIISNNAGYLNTWADEFARGLGHLVRDNPQLWATYHPFMLANANAAWNSRRTDLNLAWNGWTQQTPNDPAMQPTKAVSAVAMLQFTPAVQPVNPIGVRSVINKHSGLALENPAFSTANGTIMDQWGYNGGANQRWNIVRNSDATFTFLNVHSGLALDNPGSTANGAKMVQWGSNGGNNQRWILTPGSDGAYRIVNKFSSLTLEVPGYSTTNGTQIDQWGYDGGAHQRWGLQ